MECRRLHFSGHAVRRMFERQIREEDVRLVVESGEVIADYPDDTPYPSRLLLGSAQGLPLHVVVAVDPTRLACYVVTVYAPDPSRWDAGFKRRRQP